MSEDRTVAILCPQCNEPVWEVERTAIWWCLPCGRGFTASEAVILRGNNGSTSENDR